MFDIQKKNFYLVGNTIGGPLSHQQEFRTDYNNSIVYKLEKYKKPVNHKIEPLNMLMKKLLILVSGVTVLLIM